MRLHRPLCIGAAALLLVSLVTVSAPATASTRHDHEASGHGWTQFGFSAAKTGWTRDEDQLTQRNVASLRERWASQPG
jgi:Spy/CpxP family protein refolding chaperone